MQVMMPETISLDQIKNIWLELNEKLKNSKTLDWSRVSDVDSSAVSLMLQIQRKHGSVLHLNLPLSLRSLLRLYNIENLFNILDNPDDLNDLNDQNDEE